MREVIQGLVEAEGEARRIVQAARAEADRLVSAAEQRALAMAATARREARAQAIQTIEAAVKAAQEEKRKRLEQAAAEVQSQVRMDEAVHDRFVEAVVRCVCGQQ